MRKSRFVSLIAPTGVLMVALFFDARASVARPEYTRKTKKECLSCHPPDSFQLTEPGRYYRDHRTLDGYEPKPKPKEGSGVNQHFTSPTSLAVDTAPVRPDARGSANGDCAGLPGVQALGTCGQRRELNCSPASQMSRDRR